MSHRRSSQPSQAGASLSVHTQQGASTRNTTTADQVAGWRQWPANHQRGGHRTLRMAMARYFHRNGCEANGL